MLLKINNKKLNVKDIKTNSKKVKSGDLFIAYRGVNIDSHQFISEAIENGAKYVIGEISREKIADQFPPNFNLNNYIKVSNPRKTWTELEAQKYNNPEKKLKIIGITGADGKTTTVHLIYNVLKTAGKKTEMISTLGATLKAIEINTGTHVTTPTPDVLFKILSQMVNAGTEYVVMEITSIALLQKRVFKIPLIVAGITNITHEHYDAHGNYESLVKAKSKIFSMTESIFLNKTTKGYKDVIKNLPKGKNVIEVNDTDFNSQNLDKNFRDKFPGKYNIDNAKLAYSICKFLKIPKNKIIEGLNTTVPPAGRFQKIQNKFGINVVVDFAHTPNALRQLLETVNKQKSKKAQIITVFGLAGERDTKKRSQMGKVAECFSNFVIVTSNNSRSENPFKIALDIIANNPYDKFIIDQKRKRAIETALNLANKGDWVLILGKGHEIIDDQDNGKFTDVDYVFNALKKYESKRKP